MSTEKLHFEIGLGSTHWGKHPKCTILVDKAVQFTGFIADSQAVKFDVELEEAEHLLEIRLENKENDDTVQSADFKTIEKDLLLNIESLAIDNIDVSNLRWTKSEYILDEPAEIEPGVFKDKYTGCVNLGHNGSWQFKFTSPFYIWLLENL